MSAFKEPAFAWEPITPRGVAAFARASFERLFVVQAVVALLGAAAIVWVLSNGIFPTIDAAIAQLPDTGQIHFKGPNQDTLITYLNELTGALGAAFDVRPAHTTPQDWMLLRSPAGHIWQITVSDTGVLTTTQIFQQT